MTIFKRCSLVLFIALSGCKVQIEVPEGGSVTTVSGAYSCSAGQKCVVEIADLLFDETFVAVPQPGMSFVEWKKRPWGFFGESRNPEARLFTRAFEGNSGLMAFLDNDEVFYLEPVFKKAPVTSPPVPGGTPSSPAQLSLKGQNTVGANSFYNYFKYAAKNGEKLVLRSTLSIPLSDTQKSRCSSNPGTGAIESYYDTQIHIFDESLNRLGGICGESLTFGFQEAGNYIVQFDYPDNGTGYADSASIIGELAITSPTGTRGSPSNPKSVLTHTSNILMRNTFHNYYRYTADEGDRIIVNVMLDQPMTTQQKTRCGSSYPSPTGGYDTQIYVYDINMNWIGGSCGEDLTFEFPESGNFILHFGYGAQSAGYFNAAIIK